MKTIAIARIGEPRRIHDGTHHDTRGQGDVSPAAIAAAIRERVSRA